MSKLVKLTDISVDSGTQIRASIDQQVVADYAEAMTNGATFPAIVLFHDGNTHHVGDGFHRLMAAQRNQMRDIPADVQPGTQQDALWFALGANKANGKRLTEADKRHAILMALRTWPERSTRTLAEQIGCSAMWVSKVKDETGVNRFTPDARVTGKDGKSYPASRPSPSVSPARDESVAVLDPEPRPVVSGRPSAPSNGLQFARIAIMKLAEIRNDDSERQQAFDLVRSWLDERER